MTHPFPTRWNPYTHPDAPLHWRKPRMVRFVGDPFRMLEDHRTAPDWAKESAEAAVDRIFAVMALCPKSTFLVSTERPGRMREYLADRPAVCERVLRAMAVHEEAFRGLLEKRTREVLAAHLDGTPMPQPEPDEHGYLWPLPNVVLATVVRTQEEADERIPELLECPAVYRAVFLEPRERLNIEYYLPRKLETCQDCGADDGERDHYGRHAYCGGEFDPQGSTEGIDWLHIAGGREPLDLAWVRSLIAQADAAGVPVWMERLGNAPYAMWADSTAEPERQHWLRIYRGRDDFGWPADLRRRERLEVK